MKVPSNLLEISFFCSELKLDEELSIISDDLWAQAKRKLKGRFGGSPNFEICRNLILNFETINPKYKYKSDLGAFIRESKLEDFWGDNTETIFVSTVHKAKGREFDHVFLMLDRFDPGTDEEKRQLYVAMTRAKQNLTIHYNGNYLDFIKTSELRVINDSDSYLPPAQLAVQLTHRDVWLSFFESRQYLIEHLNSGDTLAFNQDGCHNAKGQTVLKFSQQFSKRLEAMVQRNYLPQSAKVRFIVLWQREDAESEIKIVLPELYFERKTDME